jgi:hypothetical protein
LSSSSIAALASLPIGNNIISTNLAVVPLEGTSHLSDHLTDVLQQQAALQITSSSSSLTDTARLPPPSTPNASEYTSYSFHNNNSLVLNTFRRPLSNTSNRPGGNSSAFTPYNTPGNYSSMSRDYSQTSTWNQQPSSYKATSKSAMVQPGNYPAQPSYQMPHQQQLFVGTYYPTPTLYSVIAPVDSWSTAGFEHYSAYSPTNYLPNYATQQQYHPTNVQSNKYDRYSYDTDFLSNYGQTRLVNSELSNASQTTKDTPVPSKLSANAASFSQGASLTPPSPATAFYFNPGSYAVPALYQSYQDRPMVYPSIDNRDNRTGASYAGNNNRHHYYPHQRTHHNSTWHSQQ